MGFSIFNPKKKDLIKFAPGFKGEHCTFRIYPIQDENENKIIFIPSFNIPVIFTNNDTQPTKVEQFRLKMSFQELPNHAQFEILPAKWVIDESSLSMHRDEWINNPLLEEWTPMLVLPGETKTKNIVFESITWVEPVNQNLIFCILEVKNNHSENYHPVSRWTFRLTPNEWVELAEKGKSFTASSKLSRSFID